MNIKIPKSIESPTVVIIGQKKVDNKVNEYNAKRMDLLEKKLDSQYKAFIDKTDTTKVISDLQKSFEKILTRFMQMNQQVLTSMQKDKLSSLRKEFNSKIQEMSKDDNGEMLRSFMSKLGNIERAVNRPQRTVIRTPATRPVSHDYLAKSFNALYERLEGAIMKARPRMIPSPS